MAWFLIFLCLALLVVIGNALILLRTAKKPRLPDTVRPKPYGDEED